MWNQCVTGDFTLVTNALAREYTRSEIINQCQGMYVDEIIKTFISNIE